MADTIETNTDTMEKDVNSLRATLNLIRQDMKMMFDAVTELNSTWSGLANEAFNRQFLADRGLLEVLCGEVEGMIDSMENAKDAYNKCEAEISQEIDRIRI